MPDVDMNFQESQTPSQGRRPTSTGTHSRSVIVAAVMGLVLLLLALAGYALLTEPGIPADDPFPIIEDRPRSSALPSSSPEVEGEIEEVFCTLDAKICPDGTAVGRQAPNCEFAPCPGEN